MKFILILLLFVLNTDINPNLIAQSISGKIILPDGTEIDADAAQTPVSDDLYYIVPGKCTECKGFHDEPQCAAVCPVDCCVPDNDHVESEETLLSKQRFMHKEG